MTDKPIPFDIIARDATAADLYRVRDAARAAAGAMGTLRRAAEGATIDEDRDAGHTLGQIVGLVVLVMLAFFGVLYLIAHH